MVKRALPLDPDGRSTLRDILLPPDGYRLEHALGTAYSLDAETLVTIPLFAAGIGAEDLDKSVGISRIYELGTRLTLLVQGDRISISKRWASSRPLLHLVGDAVVPCSIQGGSFHPKLLVLKFTPIDQARNKPGKKDLFRIVIATRNLTADNSWDSVVVLDQAPTGVCIPGLAEAVSGLGQFVNDKKHPSVKLCERMGNELKSVCFQPLHGVTDLEVRLFHPDSNNSSDVFNKIKGDDLLIISPFVRQGFLEKLEAQAGISRMNRWLVTRPVDVPDRAFESYQVFQIAAAAVPIHDVSDPENVKDAHGRLVGLHAKIYLASSKKGGTRLVVTSANATWSGWTRNVEIAVTGVAKAKALQVPALLEPAPPDQEHNFRSLLEEITPSAVESEESDPEWIKKARSVLAGTIVVGRVQKGPPRTLSVTVDFMGKHDWPNGLNVTMHPFGYGDHCACLTLDKIGMSGTLEIEPRIELTPFAVLTLSHGDDALVEIVLAMQLQGDLDWGRDDARATLAQSARPELYRELLWYFGVKGNSGGSQSDHVAKVPAKVPRGGAQLPIFEKILLRVHGPNGQAEVAMIDSLLAGLTNDAEDERLTAMWRLVKESLK